MSDRFRSQRATTKKRELTLSVLSQLDQLLSMHVTDESRRRVVNAVDGIEVGNPFGDALDQLDLSVSTVVRSADLLRVVGDVVGRDVT